MVTIRVSKTGETNPPEIAVIVSKKIAKSAVSRNRIRRRLYAAMEPFVSKLPEGFRFFVYPKQSSEHATFKQLSNEYKTLLERTGLHRF